jgi:hypothetical protein
MKITDLLTEFDASNIKTGVNVLGHDVTTGDVTDIAKTLGIDPKDALKYGLDAYTIANTKIPGTDYTVADAANMGIDVASFLPIARAGKAMAAGKSTAPAMSSLGKRQVAAQATKQIGKSAVNVDGTGSSTSGGSALPTKKKSKFAVGDKIAVKIKGDKFKLPIVGLVPSGYLVDISSVPGKSSGQTMTVSDPMNETATEGSTSAGNVASLGQSPHIAGGTPAVLKRWSGTPGSSGTSGKSIKHKKVKSQSAKDNPITNTNVGNNLIA